jgi:hypothetical protein
VQSLNCFQTFEPFQKKLLTKKNNLEIISSNLIQYKNFGTKNKHLGKSNEKILTEIIEKYGIEPIRI